MRYELSLNWTEYYKAINDLNYSPSYTWQDAVKKTVEWYEEYFLKNDAPSGTGFKPPEAVYKK